MPESQPEGLPAYPENLPTDYVSQRHLHRQERYEREHELETRRRWAAFLRHLNRTASAYGPVDLSTGVGDDIEREDIP